MSATTCPDCDRLRAAISDIDAHATPLGEDEDGFVTGGYLISVGSLHRALALASTAPPCRVCGPESHDCPAENGSTRCVCGLDPCTCGVLRTEPLEHEQNITWPAPPGVENGR